MSQSPSRRSNSSALLFSFIATAAIAAATFAFGLSEFSWAGWLPATCVSTNCFCEGIRLEPIIQPANAFSNLAFVWVGSLILISSFQREKRLSPSYPQPYARLFGSVVVLIGLGSLFYHASLSFVGQWFDVMGMYLLITFVLLHSIRNLGTLQGRQLASFYFLNNLVLGIILLVFPQIRREIFLLLVLIAVGAEIISNSYSRTRLQSRYFLTSLAIFAAAYLIWVLDNSGMLCSPDSWLQGHAIWHLSSALSAGLLHLYFSSDISSPILSS